MHSKDWKDRTMILYIGFFVLVLVAVVLAAVVGIVADTLRAFVSATKEMHVAANDALFWKNVAITVALGLLAFAVLLVLPGVASLYVVACWSAIAAIAASVWWLVAYRPIVKTFKQLYKDAQPPIKIKAKGM